MNLNWFESILYGLLSGLMDILPVSAQAHRVLLLKFFGVSGSADLLNLLIHLGITAALYISSQTQISKMMRARSLARIPKRRRKRPLDTRSMMDFSLLKTMILPVIVSLFFYEKVSGLSGNLLWVAVLLFVNGIILYVPQFLPSSNRDSRTLSRVEGLLMGLGGAVSILPGVSAIGSATSIGSVCGVERSYSLNMALMMNMVINVGLIVFDVMGIAANGLSGLTFILVIRYIASALTAFGGAMLGIKLMRTLASNMGFSLFGFYCWGVALFTFILNLMA